MRATMLLLLLLTATVFVAIQADDFKAKQKVDIQEHTSGMPSKLIAKQINYIETEQLETQKLDLNRDRTRGTEIEVSSQSWCMIIDTPGYYELTQDIINCTTNGIYISASNVILDGKGHILDGVNNDSSRYGIYVDHAQNVIIRNLKIQEWSWNGIILIFSSNSSIYNNTIQNNEIFGIQLFNSYGNKIYNNTIQNNKMDGIFLDSSTSNSVYNNTIQNNKMYGVHLYKSTGNSIHNNSFSNDGMLVIRSYNNSVLDNTINGKPIVFMEDQRDVVVDIEAGQIILVRCENITIKGQNITNTSIAIELWKTNNTKIYNSAIQNSKYGIYLINSSRNIIYKNIIQNNSYFGIYFSDSPGNFIILNRFVGSMIFSPDNNIWFTPRQIPYKYQGVWYIGQLGNYWDAYTGSDANGDHVGDTPYGDDTAPLMNDPQEYYIGDYDGDGVWDLYEVTMYKTDPIKTDTDGDMLPDYWEIKYGLNATNYKDATQDKDNDGLTNLEEYQHGTNPTIADTDGDGIPDGWEVSYNLNPTNSSDASKDEDGDLLTNLEEYQHGTNPTIADTDGDGIPDGWEVSYNLNPTNSSDASVDSDGDGLSNALEFVYGTDLMNPDSDGDGYEDGFEVYHGSDPLDADDYPVSSPSIPVFYWVSLIASIIANVVAIITLILIIKRNSSF